MRNELEWALADGHWGKAAHILESINGDSVIADTFARKALAALLREHDKKGPGRPRKLSPVDRFSLIEMMILKELQELTAASGQKEAEKLAVAEKYGLKRSSLEALEKRYREDAPHLFE